MKCKRNLAGKLKHNREIASGGDEWAIHVNFVRLQASRGGSVEANLNREFRRIQKRPSGGGDLDRTGGATSVQVRIEYRSNDLLGPVPMAVAWSGARASQMASGATIQIIYPSSSRAWNEPRRARRM